MADIRSSQTPRLSEELTIALCVLEKFLNHLFDKVEAIFKTVKSLMSEIKAIKHRLNYLEDLHAEEENRKDKSRGWNYKPDDNDDNYCSKADRFEHEESADRLGSS